MAARSNGMLVAASVLLAACGQGSKDTPAPAAPAAGIPAVAAEERRVRTLARSGQRRELGADADTIFSEIDQAWAGGLPNLPWAVVAPVALQTPARLLLATGPEIGDTAVSAMAGLLAALEPGLDPTVLNGRTGSKHADMPFGSADHTWILSMAQSGSTLAVGITARTTYTGRNGKVIDELATASAEIQFCPDAEGKVPFTHAISFNVTTPGGGSQVNLSATGTATVSDDGQLGGWSSVATLGFAAQGGAVPVTGADGRVRIARSYDGGGHLQGSTRTVERDTVSASVASAIGDIGSRMPGAVESYLLEKAQARWQHGACVEIVVEGAGDQNTVAPSSRSSFTGKVRHRFEGAELAAPIGAALDGGKSLSPTARTPAPVAYGYGAPDEEDQLATVALETSSRRGKARKAVTFFTRALQAYGGTITFSGTKVDPIGSQTFHWTGTARVRLVRTAVAGGGATFQPDPASGSVRFEVFSLDTAQESCGLVGPAVGGPSAILGGNMVLHTTPARYAFTLAVVTQGASQCVDKSTGRVTGGAASPGADLTTSPGGGDPGFRAVSDPALLTGTAHFHQDEGGGAYTDQDTSWNLTPQ